jgi:hypothetical protein
LHICQLPSCQDSGGGGGDGGGDGEGGGGDGGGGKSMTDQLCAEKKMCLLCV